MSEFPIAKRELTKVKLGVVDGEKRGDNIMDPVVELEDYYYWLRDDKRENKEVLDHLNKENENTKKIMDEHNTEVDNMFKEIKSHIKETHDSYPYPHGEEGWNTKYRYFTRTVEGKSYTIHCRKNMLTNENEILLDINKLAKDKSHFDVSSFQVTDDHKYMSYGTDENGNEKYKLVIKEINTKNEMVHEIPELMYCSYFWHKNYIYYEMGNDSNRIYQIWKYNFITKDKELLFQNDDRVTSVGISMTNDRKYFFISASSYNSSEYYYFTEEDPKIKLFAKKIEGVKYGVDYHEGRFFIVTNKDESRNFKIMTTELDKTEMSNWKEFMPYDKNKFIKGLYELKNYLIVIYKENGTNNIKIINYKDGKYDIKNSHNLQLFDTSKEENELNILRNYLNNGQDVEEKIKTLEKKIISFQNRITNLEVSSLDIYDTNIIWFTNDSLDTPVSLYEYNLNDRSINILREKDVPNFNKAEFESQRLYATSHDGVKVPISIVYKKSLFKKDGSNPLYLYGYGSYGITVDADFSSKIIPLLDRGFVYAIGHVRGGSFLGYDWYEDGKMKNKMNTFYDFIACAEYLNKENYTFNKGITIEGRSAGGLLVGACMTMRPDLFRTVIGGVPFVDVLTTMADPSIPLTTPEWEQWGNPNQKEHYEYMKQYSPYDNIRETEYPNALILAGLNDPRVQYWEPAKFVAKLRHHKKDSNLLLLKTEMDEGHFGGSDRYKYMKELSFSYIFVLKTYNMLGSNIKYNINYS